MNSFLRFIIVTLLLTAAQVWAQDVVVETNPRNPVKGEPFQIVFKCQTTKASDPEITFDAEGFEVLGRQSQGLSTRTVYAQGKIQVSRELMIVYEAVAPKAGRVNLKNLVVVLEGKRMSQALVPIQVMEAPVEPRMVFIAAEVPKKTLYAGGGFLLRYCIYIRTNLPASDVKKSSKLDRVMKRFLQEPENIQRVTVDGEPYRRSVIYSARVYPERSGKLIIDPMEVSASYGADPFAALGFGFSNPRDARTKLLSSEPVEVDVKPLPLEGRPTSFTGLVGRHIFDLKATRSQILVNEPMEVKLSVSGPGNLENYEAPVIWNVPELERFDVKSDLALQGGESAIKIFDFTYLGKTPGLIKGRDAEFSYFDPSTQRYEVVRKPLPEIIVAGNANPKESPPAPGQAPKADEKAPGLVPAVENFGVQSASLLSNPFLWLGILAVVLLGLVGLKARNLSGLRAKTKPAWEKDFQELIQKGPSSALLTRLLHALSPRSELPLSNIMAQSGLSPETQEYFQQVLIQLERREFATSRPTGDIVVDKKHLQALQRKLKDIG